MCVEFFCVNRGGWIKYKDIIGYYYVNIIILNWKLLVLNFVLLGEMINCFF